MHWTLPYPASRLRVVATFAIAATLQVCVLAATPTRGHAQVSTIEPVTAVAGAAVVVHAAAALAVTAEENTLTVRRWRLPCSSC
jgi:hypothetical protein